MSFARSEQRVPFLGRIPGLGWLFRAQTTETVKRISWYSSARRSFATASRPASRRTRNIDSFAICSSNRRIAPCRCYAVRIARYCPAIRGTGGASRTKSLTAMAANLELEPDAPEEHTDRRLPFAFAKRHGVLLMEHRTVVRKPFIARALRR